MPEVEIADLPFVEAISFFKEKVALPSATWRDLWEGMHARAFTVAGAMRDDLLAGLREAVQKAIEKGTTLAEFRRDFDRIVAETGWSYRGRRGPRTATIFNTNIRTAYAAGRWQQSDRVKAELPFLRYGAILDSRVRPQHRAWHGTILPVDDPWWQTHYPPNGWGCRCTTTQLTRGQAQRMGGPTPAPPVDRIRQTVRTADGPVTVEVPRGIDPGWAYNVGEAAWGRSEQLRALDAHGPWTPLTSPVADAEGALAPLVARAARVALGRPVPRGDEAGLRTALRTALGGEAATLSDPTGTRVRVTQALVDHILEAPERRWDGREAFFPLIPELIESPAEIWVGFARGPSGRIALRRRYLALLDLGRQRSVGIVADAEGGLWSGLTFFRGDPRYLARMRTGLRVLGG